MEQVDYYYAPNEIHAVDFIWHQNSENAPSLHVGQKITKKDGRKFVIVGIDNVTTTYDHDTKWYVRDIYVEYI